MSIIDYKISQEISADDPPFYALIMAAMRKADTDNLRRLKHAWPAVWDELERRYHAPSGALPEEDLPSGQDRRGSLPDRRQREIIRSDERREEGRDRRSE